MSDGPDDSTKETISSNHILNLSFRGIAHAPEIYVPIFSDLVPGGFCYGANYLVEFDPNSLWYEASLTIAARALKSGVRTQYHSFMHIPSESRRDLEKLGVDLKKLESEDKFRFVDSYTGLTGLPIQGEKGTLSGRSSIRLNDPSFMEKFAANIVDLLRTGAPESDKRWLHIDDNTSIFNRYLKEQMFCTPSTPSSFQR